PDPGRSRCPHRAGGEECDPHRRIRQAGRGRGGDEQNGGRGPCRALASAPDPDDQLRLHLRGDPARDRDRAGTGDAPGARHRGYLRDARGDLLRTDLHSGLLCRLPRDRRADEGVGKAPEPQSRRRQAAGGSVMMRSFLLAATAALALSGCTAGPAYVSPVPTAPSQSPFVEGEKSPVFTGDQPPGEWWSLFGDPALDALVEQALAANTDLRVAAANLAQARAVLKEAKAGRLPTTRVGASGAYARQGGSTTGIGPVEGETYDVGLDVGYQVDLFGRVESAIRASRADAQAVQAAFDLTRITVAAETTRAYADVCAFNRQLAVARDTLRIQEQTFDLTRRLFEGGRATRLETGQAGALLEQTRATLPTLEAQRSAALFRLAVMTALPPAEAPKPVPAGR